MSRAVIVLVLLCAGRASAQERAFDGSQTAETVSARYTAGLPARVSLAGADQGTVRDGHMEFSYQRRLPVNDRLTAIAGGGYRRTDLFLSGGAPFPSALQSLNVRVGGDWKFNERWTAGASVSPGVYGDTDLDRRDDFKAPISVFARYSPRSGLVWMGGLAVGFFGRRGVTPFLGVMWKINEKWRLNAVPPMARLTYTAARTKEGPVNLFLGFGFDGGRYQVAPDFGNRFNRPELNGNTLSVQQGDLRTGVSAATRFLTGELGVGYQFARRYRYEQAAETFKVRDAPYLSASLLARF